MRDAGKLAATMEKQTLQINTELTPGITLRAWGARAQGTAKPQ